MRARRAIQRTFAVLIFALVCALIPIGRHAQADSPRPDGRTYAVLVGVADYPSSPLPRTDRDAERIGEALARHLPADRLETHLLLNRDATRANLSRALAEVARDATERDEVVFFFSGHGGTTADEPDGDEGDGLDETILLYDGEVTDDELGRMLHPIKSRMAIVALDSCFSGGFLFDVGNEHGRIAMFSSDEDLTSAVPSQEAGGWLSLYLAEALEGRADGAADGVSGQELDGQLTALEIETYIEDRFASQQRITASDPGSREVGYQRIDIKRTGVAPDDVFMNLSGDGGGVARRVVADHPRLSLAGSLDFASATRVEIPVIAGSTYVVETYDLGPSTDTVLELRQMRGSAPAESDPVVAQNDDADGLASRVRWTASQGGRHYALVHPYAPQTGGPFGLRVVELTLPADAPRPEVMVERAGITLPGTQDFASLPTEPLALERGTTYVIETFGLTGQTDTVLQLRRMAGASPSPSDPVVAENDDADGLASRVRWTASESGRYYAIVRPYAPQTAGTFGLRVSRMAAPGASPAPVPGPIVQPPVAPSPVVPSPAAGVVLERRGVTLPGAMDFASLPSIEVPLAAGHRYTVETFDLAGNTDTVIELRRMTGAAPSEADPVLARNDDDGVTLASRIDVTPSEAGRYYVHVSPYAPTTGGSFGLRVIEGGGTAGPVAPVGAAVLERRGIPLPGSMDFASLPAIEVPLDAGRAYVIETFDLAGDTDTVIELRRALNGTPSSSDPVLARNDDDGRSLASRIEHTPGEAGTYYVLVSPYAPQTGGSFGLRVLAC